jgi:branched-chain amino acid transport system substrate-binding protein
MFTTYRRVCLRYIDFGNVLKMREDIFWRVIANRPMTEGRTYKATKHREVVMRRRDLLKYAGATAIATPFVRVAHADQGTIKVGVVGAKTGPLAPAAAGTFFPPWRLWAHEVNQAGGVKLKGGARKVELIEYDDHTQPPESIKAIERLATVDKADWIVGLYSTGFNIAAVPTFTKLGYPQLAVACVTNYGADLIKKNPQLFFANGTTSQYTSAVIDVLKKLQADGQLGKKIAMVNVADDFGIECSNISKKLLSTVGFDIVYDKSYPLGTQDYSPIIKAAKAANPDAFIAYSYPPDTFGLTDQAKIEDLNVKAYYNGVGCAFAGFYGKYGAAAENVIGFGGMPDNQKTRAFLNLHKEVTGIDADYNACAYIYANGQVLTQAFEAVGTLDREAITAYLKSHTFQTLLGEIDLRSQLQNIAYTVGQWQNGFFHSVAAVGVPESEIVAPRAKTGWA